MSDYMYDAPGGVQSALDVIWTITCACGHSWLVPGHQVAHLLRGQRLSMGKLCVGRSGMRGTRQHNAAKGS